tara:strand:+ start:344 stop:820 length:477 start_codon:yes stop_codon:yes gene_type:complete
MKSPRKLKPRIDKTLLDKESAFWKAKWLEIGKANCFIQNCFDPEFDLDCFAECTTLDQLFKKLCCFNNWCTGQAFYYQNFLFNNSFRAADGTPCNQFIFQNFCFINQQNGGSEWLCIRGDLSFESLSGACFENERGEFDRFISRITKATDQELKSLAY